MRAGNRRTMPWLEALAVVQGAVIATLVVLLLRGEDVAPAPVAAVPPPPATSLPAAASDQGAADEPSTPPGEATPAPRALTPEGTILFGLLVDEAGDPVGDGHVSLTREGAARPIETRSSEPRGEFVVAGLLPGSLAVRVRAVGYHEGIDTIDIPAGTARLRHDIVLQQAWNLRVKIQTPEGQPLHEVLQELNKTRHALFWLEVTAVATPYPPDGDLPPTDQRNSPHGIGRWRGASGPFAVRDGPKVGSEYAGTLEFTERRPVWVSAVLRHRVLATAAVAPGQHEVALTVALGRVLQQLGTIRLRVVDGMTGVPAAGARVGFSDGQTLSGGEDRTDVEGRIEVHDLRPGLLHMTIAGRERSGLRAEVLLAPGQTLDLGDVVVMPFTTVEGRYEHRGESSKPPAVFAWLRTASSPALRPEPIRAQVAMDGTFQLHLPVGSYFLRATGGGGATATIDTRALGSAPLVLQLAEEAAIRIDARTGGEMLQVSIFGPEGTKVSGRWLQQDAKYPILVLPGDYRVELEDRRGNVTRRTLHVGPEGVDLRVP
ncbi:MAG TPA: carboxypeptidase-like regulatory domain-containing protein [Planctomycetota bacterium]|nr:carboxypeptidase-like regulatory domain-containing protein [Planctomycetota bacterium]